MAEIVEVSDRTFEAEVLKSGQTVVVDFWASWCQPCRAIAPVLKDVAATLDDRVKIAKLNIDDAPQTSEAYRVRSIPTLLVFRDGQVVDQMTGFTSKQAVMDFVRRQV